MGDIRSVLFVCLGNICRSPMAEAVFIEVAKQKDVADKWHVESAATAGFHIGCSPDERTLTVLRENNIQFKHSARQLVKEDFNKFDFIFGMDKGNIADINRIKPKDSKAQILMLGSFDPEGETTIRDPYYDKNNRGFEKCFQQCMRSCKAFLDKNS